MTERVPCHEHAGDPLDNDDCLGIYLAMRAQGHGASQSAKEIRTVPLEVRRKLRNDPVFAEAVRDADHEYAERLEDKVRQLAEEGDRWALAIILKRKAPEVYGPLHEERKDGAQGQQGNVTLQIGTVNVSDLDGVQALAKALAARQAPKALSRSEIEDPPDLDLPSEEL